MMAVTSSKEQAINCDISTFRVPRTARDTCDITRVTIMTHVSNEKKAPGWLGYIGDYTNIIKYRDYNKPL